MLGRHEEYVSPVGFAREPAQLRRHWLGRILLAGFIGLLGFLLINGVLSPPDSGPAPTPTGSTLPGPL